MWCTHTHLLYELVHCRENLGEKVDDIVHLRGYGRAGRELSVSDLATEESEGDHKCSILCDWQASLLSSLWNEACALYVLTNSLKKMF